MKFKKDVALKDMGAYEENTKYEKYKTKWIAICAVPTAIMTPFIIPLFILFSIWGDGRNNPVSFSTRWNVAIGYFQSIIAVIEHKILFISFLKSYVFFWFKPSPGPGLVWNTYVPLPVIILLWLIPPLIIAIVQVKANPFRATPNVYGDARWATEQDIVSMGNNDMIGFEKTEYDDGKKMELFTIGRFKPKNSKESKLLRMGETLSILLLAPPGTGKTAGFIVPSTVTMDNVSLFLHDQKPELFDITSGWRSTLGPVFQLKWSAQNAPEGDAITEEQKKIISPDLLLMKNGEYVKNEDGDYLTKPIFYPSWNPLSAKSMPGPGTKRDLYIDRLVNVLVPAPKGGGDTFWVDKGRTALLGLIHYLVAKIDFANHPAIQGGWDGIPEHWRGREASFPMLISWYNYIQQIDDENAKEDDPMRGVFKKCADDAKAMDDKFEEVYKQRFLDRAINELTGLMNAPDKTRGSILQTMDASLNAFKSAAVSERTASSDFAFNELRGMPIPEAKAREMEKVKKAALNGKIYKPRYKKEEYKPVTIYISIPAEDAKTFATLTGIFVDAANAYLVANGPNSIDDQGNQNGPYPFGFLLDEAPQLPKLDTVMNGPAVGRSKKVFYVIVGQDFGQFAEKYSKDEVGSLKSITAIKLMLSQNNEESAKQIVNMVGKTTIVKHNYSPKGDGQKGKGLGGAIEDIFKGLGGKKMSASESLEGVDFIKADEIMSLPKGRHIAIIQNYANRPLYLETPFFFKPEAGILDRVYNPKSGKGRSPTTPMPIEDITQARLRWIEQNKRLQDSNKQKERENNPHATFIISPEDMIAFKNAAGKNNDFNNDDINTWHLYKVRTDKEINIDVSNIVSTNDPAEAATLIDGGRTIMFDHATLNRLNSWIKTVDQEEIPEKIAMFIDERAASIEEDVFETLYSIGIHDSMNLVLSGRVDTEMAMEWITMIYENIINAEDEQKFLNFS